MAELAVGLSKTVVQGAITKVQSVIDEDAKLRQKARRDLVSITLEFEMMNSFLNVANMETSVKNNLVMTWVKHVRDLAYDLEDHVEFVVHLDDEPMIWHRFLPSCVAPALPLDQAVAGIEELRARAEELSKCYLRYSHISDSASSKLVMMQQPASTADVGAKALAILIEASEAAKRNRGLQNLTHLVTKEEDHLQVISVWGTSGDLGKTSVMRKAYVDPSIISRFCHRAWVKLMHPFNPHEFIRRFMSQIYINSCQDNSEDEMSTLLRSMAAKEEEILQEFKWLVRSSRYLLVLEDLPDMVDWDAIRTFFPDVRNGSRIIVSIQGFEMATLCVGRSYQAVELEKFSVDHSVYAFFAQAIGSLKQTEKFLLSKGRMEGWMECSLVERRPQQNELAHFLINASSHYQVISVCGVPGVGKSALVRNFCSNIMLHKDQLRCYYHEIWNCDCSRFEKCGWAAVSHPFDIRDFCESLLLETVMEPIEELQRFLNSYRCLIVIDDLQSKEEWDFIKPVLVPKISETGGVIIVITTEASVAAYCTTNSDVVFNVKGLETDDAFDLFKNEVSKKNPTLLLKDRKDQETRELISKCGGFAKVIVAAACLLATETDTRIDTVSSINGRFMHHLETSSEFFSLRGIFGWMDSILHYCSESLRPCIFYLSFFPRGHIIRRRRLVRRWIAEGYSRDSHGNSAEETGEKFFLELFDMSIFQQPPQLVISGCKDTRMVLCQVNGFIQEYIISRRTEENLVFELGGNCGLTAQRMCRHLIILRSWDRDRNVLESMDFSRLRSLTVFGEWKSFFVSESMKLLRVLDLEDALGVTDDDLEKIVKQMCRLKFLSLRGCMDITYLPSSLGDLRQLQTLDVRDTSVVRLPKNIIKLRKLQYLRAGRTATRSMPLVSSSWLPEFGRRRCLVGAAVPRKTGTLVALHTLGVVNIGASRGKDTVKELRKLSQLHKLGVSGINTKNISKLLSAIEGHVHLESLSVRLDENSPGCLDGVPLPLENLRSLKLYGLNDKLPMWSEGLNKLTKLNLEMATLVKNDIEFLGKLPQLCILRVKQLQDDELHFRVLTVVDEVDSYQKVKVLEICCGCSSADLHVTFGSKTMKKLELLKVDCCSGSPMYQFSGLENLTELKQVFLLKGSTAETLKTYLESQLENHPKRPDVKLEELQHST